MSVFSEAREVMGKALKNDEGLFQSYQANVAMLLYDRYNKADFTDPETRNAAADDLIELIFNS